MKQNLCILALLLLFGETQVAQTPSTNTSTININPGIKWTEGLSWIQIKEKAMRENKYIFLDCFTTWCGPCKMMDQRVYGNKEVGSFINDKFISIRVQMDKTKSDDAYVQSWYDDATKIGKHYMLVGYPTFLFFSPSGTIIHKDAGYKDAEKFIAIVKNALSPGKIMNDDYAEYTELMAAYKHGDIKYYRLPFMIEMAKKLGDTVSRQFLRLHESYVLTLPVKQRYSKENIEFWSTLNLTTDRKIVQFFYRDADQIDQAMQKKGYARAEVDKSIQNFIVAPFINEQLKNPDAKSGVTTLNTATQTIVSNTTCYDEADWKKLYRIIRKDFNKSYAASNLLQAKIEWYQKNSNWPAYARASFKKFKIAPQDFDEQSEDYKVNGVCWDVFMYIKDKKLINEAITWIEKLVLKWNNGNILDTYANLLYKAGRKEEAIQWQQKAVVLDPANKYRQQALVQMKKGEPTYGVTW